MYNPNYNPRLNLSFAYEFNKQRYKAFWDKSIPIVPIPKMQTFNNCYLLPPRSHAGTLWGRGGVVDSDFNPVSSSSMGGCYMPAFCYDFNRSDAQSLKGEYIYCGLFGNHWGHFIVNFSSRLYAAKQYPEFKFIYLIPYNCATFDIFPSIKRFFELLGISFDRIIFLNKPTQIEHCIVPSISYLPNHYVCKEYLDIFSCVSDNIEPDCNKGYERIYLSRKKWHKAAIKEFGIELIEESFSLFNFHIIVPEEESLDNQIFYLRCAKEIGMISSSLAHNLIFSQDTQKNIYMIQKSYNIALAILEFLKFSNSDTFICDFFASKFPVTLGNGPFIFVKNKPFEDFINNYNIPIQNSFFYENEYLANTIKAYVESYYNYSHKYRPEISSDVNSSAYFPIDLIIDWYNKYYKYEPPIRTSQDNILIKEMKETINIEKKNVKELLSYNFSKPIVIYETHLSVIGWTGETFNGRTSGAPNKGHTIEALKIRLEGTDMQIFYQICYSDSVWTESASDGALIGTTGKNKKINGISIWLKCEKIKYHVEYRVFTNDWSDFKRDGYRFFNLGGFQALEIRLVEVPINNESIKIKDMQNYSNLSEVKYMDNMHEFNNNNTLNNLNIVDALPKRFFDENNNAFVLSSYDKKKNEFIFEPLHSKIKFSAKICQDCIVILDINNKFNNFALALEEVYNSTLIVGKHNIFQNTSINLKRGIVDCKIGNNNSFWNLGMNLGDTYSVTIGNEGIFAAGLQIMANMGHSYIDLNSGKYINMKQNCISIGNHVWIARNVLLGSKASIADNCIVAASSFVNDSFTDPHCLIGGTPARVLRKNIDWKEPHPSLFILKEYCKNKNLTFSYKYLKECLEEYSDRFI